MERLSQEKRRKSIANPHSVNGGIERNMLIQLVQPPSVHQLSRSPQVSSDRNSPCENSLPPIHRFHLRYTICRYPHRLNYCEDISKPRCPCGCCWSCISRGRAGEH
jgi:hypothetical protein